MAPLLFLAAFVLAALAHAGQLVVAQPGFLSIDCGLEANYSGYRDTDLGIFYVSDGPYVDSGENHRVAADQESGTRRPDLTVRSFPSGGRNCYALPTIAGAKYLVRVVAFYGNYDGKNSSSTLQFDLYLGVNYWDTVAADGDEVYEAIFVAWASWSPVCLVNTGQGTPFASSVELRALAAELYPAVMANQFLRLSIRRSMGPTNVHVTRFPTDQYDRYWWEMASNPTWANLSTTLNIEDERPTYKVPSAILQKAITAAGNGTMLNVMWEDAALREFMVFAHFADFQDSKRRQFDVYFNSDQPLEYSPGYLTAGSVYSSDWYTAVDGKVNITLAATAKSELPPMLNAFEIYTHISLANPTTFSKDFDAIMAIKLEYGVKKNWMGDPCVPTQFAWDGVKCRIMSDNITRITTVDLSNSNLHGFISSNFTLLTALEYLNLSGNQLNGPIPDSLCKINGGVLIFSYDSNQNMCNKTTNPSPRRNRTAIIAVSVAAPVLAAAVLVTAYLIWRVKRKPNISASAAPRVPEKEKYYFDHMEKNENSQFTYKELEKITNNFEHLIGEGGFGRVYHGCLEDNAEVAVKIRSETSSHGFNEFLAEVESLTKVHHKNLVSLVGYCLEKAHLALVYEYMSRGSLLSHLKGKNGDETFNWATRVRVLLDAAQGLDYLHNGCSRSIIHRDVKTSNILLDQNLQAKIADFGLSRTYVSDSQTHMTTATIAGSKGYIDPEYHQIGRITESSDVYSFGVVLLEVATGEPPILPDSHIIIRVKEKVASGDISCIADERLGGDFDVSSMWKVVEVALQCTEHVAAQRPSMAAVVVQLKESLALEKARKDSGSRTADSAGDAVSEWSVSAR